MKKLLFLFLCFFTIPTNANSYLKKIFDTDSRSDSEQIKSAIYNSDVNTVLTLVRTDVSREDLDLYVELAQNNFGRTPSAALKSKCFGFIKIALGMALLYKTVDYFKTEYVKSKDNILIRYKSMHNILMDLACLSGFISSSNFVNSGLDYIHPRSNYKKQLLINLYLKSLLKS